MGPITRLPTRMACTGIAMMAPGLIGQNPRDIGGINPGMDRLLQKPPYVKSAVDVACLGILSNATEQPVCDPLGRRRQHDAVRVVSAVTDYSLYVRQPCETYATCRMMCDQSPNPRIP